MSLKSKIKKQKLSSNIDKIKRQSFDDRICDDLSEVILQYLPFDDKFRLECVSKQFQRTIYQKVFVFNMFPLNEPANVILNYSVLKKCPNIQYLDLYFDNINTVINIENKAVEYNLVIDLIIIYCNNLREINCYFDVMNDSIKGKFIEKFGPKLKYLKFYDTFDATVLQLFANIEELDLIGTHCNLVDICQVEFKKLKRFYIDLDPNSDEELSAFLTFTDINPTIEHLIVYYHTQSSDEFNLFLYQISKLTNLIKLKISACFCLNDEPEFISCLSLIAEKCPKLKYIGCEIRTVDFDTDPQLHGLLSPLNVFNNIKRLDLCVVYDELEEMENFSCKLFKGFENITHLRLTVMAFNNEINDTKDTILEEIVINLPKLQYLKIKNNFIATDWTHIILSGLRSLQTIKLNIGDNKMGKIIKTKLNGHKKLNTIKV